VDRALAKARDDRFADIGAFVEGVTGRPLETLRGADGAAAAGGAQPARAGVATDPLAATNASQPGAPPPAAAAGGTMPAVAAGAIAPVIPASTTEKTVRRSPVAAVVAAALALIAIGGGAVWYLGRQSAPVPIARTPDPIPPAQVDKPPVKVVAADPDPVPSPREAGTGAGTGAGRGAEASKRGAAHADTTAVAPAAAEEIAQAEEALAQGNAADAIRLAQHSLYLGKSTRAFAIIVKARCRQSDLGGARAALAQIAAGQRAAVLRDCAAHGMDLR
jgi:hypothetical protein